MKTIKPFVRHEISTGFKPDMIVLDYIDCVESTKQYSDEWSGEGNVMRGFESMLSEFGVVGWTAVQGNSSVLWYRQGYAKGVVFRGLSNR